MVVRDETTVICDACSNRIEVGNAERLPAPWRIVHVPGWCGAFHVCCTSCARLLRERYERPEAECNDDTQPDIELPDGGIEA